MEQGRRYYFFGSFRLNASDKVLERDGKVVPLPLKAVETLLVLVESSGQIVSKQEISRRVWPDTFVVESNLTKNISTIRKTLVSDRDGAGVIETIPKRGYRFLLPVTETSEEIPEPPIPTPARGFLNSRQVLIVAAIGALLALSLGLTKLASRKAQPVDGGPDTAVSEAERQYLIGKYINEKVTVEEVSSALRRFEQAAKLNPNSARIHAALADAWVMLAELGGKGAETGYRRSKENALRAIELDPLLATAYVSLGVTSLVVDWDWFAAENAYRKAIVLDSKLPLAFERLACLLNRLGRNREALETIRTAQALEPVSPRIGTRACAIHYSMRQWQEAIRECRAVLDREPTHSLAHYYLGLALAHNGRYEEALEELRNSRVSRTVLLNDLGWVYARAGRVEETRKILGTVEGLVSAGELQEPAGLMLHIALDQKDKALEALELEYAKRSPTMLNLVYEPRFDPLADEPRFQTLVRRMNFPPADVKPDPPVFPSVAAAAVQ